MQTIKEAMLYQMLGNAVLYNLPSSHPAINVDSENFDLTEIGILQRILTYIAGRVTDIVRYFHH